MLKKKVRVKLIYQRLKYHLITLGQKRMNLTVVFCGGNVHGERIYTCKVRCSEIKDSRVKGKDSRVKGKDSKVKGKDPMSLFLLILVYIILIVLLIVGIIGLKHM